MAGLLAPLDWLLPDPHPPLVFEIGDGALVGARRNGRSVTRVGGRDLPATTGEGPEPPLPDGLATGIESLLPDLGPHSSRLASVLLPDSAVRLAVFEFEKLPRRPRDLRLAVQERFRSILRFDVRTARISYRRQPGHSAPSVLAAAVPQRYVEHCEEAVRLCGLVPAFVGASTASALNLVGESGTEILLKLGGDSMAIAAVTDRAVKVFRRISLQEGLEGDPAIAARDVLRDLFPTIVFVEGHLGRRVAQVLLAGFGALQPPLLAAVSEAVGIQTEPLPVSGDASAECGPGLLGYVHG